MFMNQNFRSRRKRRSTDFYRFTAEDLSLAAYKPLTDSRSEFMSICKSRKVCRKLWNFWICTIIIQLSVTHWRPTLIKRRWWISTSRNPLGLWRMSTSWFRGSRMTTHWRVGEARRHRRVPHLCTREDHCREGGADARDDVGRGGWQGGSEGGMYRYLARAHLHAFSECWASARNTLTLPAKAARAGALRARIPWARARAHSRRCLARARQFTKNARIHSLLGGVALELLDY